MKRTFDQITKDPQNPDEETKDDGQNGKTLYGVDTKRRKLSSQKVKYVVKLLQLRHGESSNGIKCLQD